MFDWLFTSLATLLAWLYELWPSYGMAIVFFTLTIMIILTPLTLKGTRSMMAMQALQPEMKRLQQQYKDDRQKLNEELLKFYRENNINPLGGCAPLLLQMPVFIVLYQVLSGLTRTRLYGYLVGAATAGTAGAVTGGFDPKYLDADTALYQALSGDTEMVSWGVDLAVPATRAMADSFVGGLPYLLLVVGVVVTSYIQQKQVSGRNPNAQMNPQQKMLLRVMPIFFAFISLSLPAALVVYFLVSNLYRVAQQEYISRKIYGPHKASTASAKPVEATATEVREDAPKGFLGRLLGEGAPRMGGAGTSGNGASTKGSSRPPAKGNGGRSGPSRPPSGRTTPAGASHPRSRKKRKRR